MTLEDKILNLKNEMDYSEGAIPFYIQLANNIKLVIRTGNHKPGEKIPSERIMSDYFNVARDTIRSTLNSLVEEKILEKIPGKGVYVAQDYIPKLPKMIVGILYINGYLDIAHPMNANHIMGIQSVFDKYGYSLEFVGVDFQVDKAKLLKDIKDKKINTFISFILEKYINDQIKKIIKDIPLISKMEENRSAYIDFAKVISLQTEYLYKQGHRHIAFNYVPIKADWVKTITTGFRNFCEKYNLVPFEIDIVNFESKLGREVIKEIVKRGDITAVIAADDNVAMGMIKGLNDMGMSCPDDISIIGMGDFTIAEYTLPGLTTIKMPYFDVGVQLARSVIYKDNLDNLQPYFVERESVKKIN